MKITAFDIYEFGILAKQSHSLPNGLLIFLGQNEAGKSTTLEFFRTLLTGFPHARSKKAREGLFSQKNPNMGGILELNTRNAGKLKLERTRANFNLFDEQGALIQTKLYESLLAGTSRDIYSSLYGFSLNELQTLDTLEEDEVRSVLYGTSFGLGLYSPQKALAQIEGVISSKSSKSLVKNESLKNLFKQNAQRIEEINFRIQELNEQNKSIDIYYNDFEKTQTALDSIKNIKDLKLEEALEIKKKIDVWPLYEDYCLLQKKIERIPAFSEFFPKDASDIINNHENHQYQVQKTINSLQTKKEHLQNSLERKEYNQSLINNLDQIKHLIEYKTSYRNSFIQLPYVKETIQRTEDEFHKQIKNLGNGWSEEKIQSIDCSLAVHKEIETHKININSASDDLKTHQQTYDHLTQEKQMVRSESEHLQETLEALPNTDNGIPLSARNELAKVLQRTQDAIEFLPEKLLHLERAKNEFTRSINQLSFKITASDEILSELANAQEKSLKLAKEIIEQEQIAKQTKQIYLQSKKDFDKLEEQHEQVSRESQKHLHLQRSSIYKKRNAIQRIKALIQMQGQELDRYIELEEQYNEIYVQLPIKTTNILILLLGICTFLMGTVLLVSGLLYNVKEIDISMLANQQFLQSLMPEALELPSTYINHSPFAFLLFLLGFTSIYLNIPMYSPDRQKKLKMLAQIEARKTSIYNKIKKNQEEAQSLAHFLELESFMNKNIHEITDVTEIENLELILEEEQVQLINNEKLIKETSTLELELEKAANELHHEFLLYQNAENKTQNYRREWQQHFINLSVSDIPSPEGAEAYFARIDKILIVKQNLSQQAEEIETLKNANQNLYNTTIKIFRELHIEIPSSFPSSEESINENTSSVNNIIKKVQEILDNAYENDKINERKEQLAENLTVLVKKEKNIISAFNLCEEKKNHAEEKLAIYQSAWKEYLKIQDLETNLSPEATITLLNHIEKCRATQASLVTLRNDLQIHINELERLEIPMKNLLSALQRDPLLRLDRQPDYLATLDILYSEADKAKEIFASKLSIEEQINELEFEINQLQNEKDNNEKEILKIVEKAEVSSYSEFKEFSKNFEEYQSLKKSELNLIDTLSFIASQKGLDNFLKELESNSLEQLLQLQNKNNEEQLEINQELDELATKFAEIKAFIKEVEASTELSDLLQEKTNIEEKNANTLENYLSYALAKSFIQKAKHKFEEERQPELIKTASEIFSHITDGKWVNITSSIEDNTLKINPKIGAPLTPDKLSQGTREQLYLSLRLAYIKNSAKYKESLPLIMDDILVNFDTTRSTQTAKTLATLINSNSKEEMENEHQVLFFTCHPHIATILQENVQQSTLYTIDKGIISLKSS